MFREVLFPRLAGFFSFETSLSQTHSLTFAPVSTGKAKKTLIMKNSPELQIMSGLEKTASNGRAKYRRMEIVHSHAEGQFSSLLSASSLSGGEEERYSVWYWKLRAGSPIMPLF